MSQEKREQASEHPSLGDQHAAAAESSIEKIEVRLQGGAVRTYKAGSLSAKLPLPSAQVLVNRRSAAS